MTAATRDGRSLRSAPPDEPVLGVHAGLVDYPTAWDWQRTLVARRAEDAAPDTLLTLEHPRVFTAGRTADLDHLLWTEEERVARGVAFHEVDRGGDVTYHGPGQLVAYPILRLEDVCVRVAADHGIDAHPVPGLTGVWVDERKLVAIGVRVSSRGVTSHGLAFNVTTDLRDFEGIVPCGIEDRGVCSLESLGVEATVEDVLVRLRRHFGEVFGCTVEVVGTDALGLDVPARSTL